MNVGKIKILEIKPVKIGSNEDLDPNNTTTFLFLSQTEQKKPEKGILICEIDLFDCNKVIKEDEIYFIAEIPIAGIIISVNEINNVKVQCNIFVNYVFESGFKEGFFDTVGYVENVFVLNSVEKYSEKFCQEFKQQLTLLLKQSGLQNYNAISDLIKEKYILLPLKDDSPSNSYFFGRPQLEDGMEYPCSSTGEPMEHLLAIYTGDFINNFQSNDSKEHYYIHFYIDTANSDNDLNENKIQFKIIKSLHGEPDSNPDDWVYKHEWMKIISSCSMPAIEDDIISSLKLNERDEDIYYKLFAITQAISNSISYNSSQFLGYSEYPMNYEEDVEGESINNNVQNNDWQLLLFINPSSEPFSSVPIWDSGELEFIIKKNDLINGNFDHVRLINNIT